MRHPTTRTYQQNPLEPRHSRPVLVAPVFQVLVRQAIMGLASVAVCFIGLAQVGCQSNTQGGAESAQYPAPSAQHAGSSPGTPIPVTLGSEGEVVAIPADEPERPRRRMDIDQLEASIVRVTGGLTWTDAKGNNQFTALAATLGKPDYLTSTLEELGPSVLFEKFMGDAARSVCVRLVDQERTASADARVLLKYASPTDTWEQAPEVIDQNLRYLLLRFHGRQLAPYDPQLNQWSWLFQTTTYGAQDPMIGWRAVCVGLLLHPDFYSY